MSYGCKEIEYLTYPDFKERLDYAVRYRACLIRAKYDNESISQKAFIEPSRFELRLLMKWKDGKAHYYVLAMDGSTKANFIKPNSLWIWRDFCRYFYKPPKMHKSKKDAPFSAVPFSYVNRKYVGQSFEKAYCYDMNSNYSNAMVHAVLPDCYRQLPSGSVQRDEIGFDADGNTIFEGYAFFRFKRMGRDNREKIISYARKWYGIKSKAEMGSELRDEAKARLNIIVGYFQRNCCFLRQAIVNYANAHMQSIVDRHRDVVLLSNTDSVVTLTPLPELELGKELGQWKLEHEGPFAYTGVNYTWLGTGDSRVRGLSHYLRDENYNVLEDNRIVFRARYGFNELKGELYEIQETVLSGEDGEGEEQVQDATGLPEGVHEEGLPDIPDED